MKANLNNLHIFSNCSLDVNERFGRMFDWSEPSARVFGLPNVDGSIGYALNGAIKELEDYLDAYAASTLGYTRESDLIENERHFNRIVKALHR